MHGLLDFGRYGLALRKLGNGSGQYLHLVACWLLLLPVLGFAEASSTTLKDVSFSALPGDRVQITLSMSGPVPEPSRFTMDQPARIALDFPGTKSGLPRKSHPVGVGMVRSINAVEAMGRTRVVINLVSLVPYESKVVGDKVLITLDSSGSTALTQANTERSSPRARRGARSKIKHIDFRRGPKGEGRVLVTLSDPSIGIDIREEGGKVVVDFLNSELPEKLARRLDVTDFATPVVNVDARPMGNNVHMLISPTGEYEHLAYQADELFVVEFKPLSKEQKEELEKKRFQYTGQRLSLNFQDIEIRAVLQLLADFTDLNFVTSDTVSGNLTLRLRNVPWDQALDIILKSKGLSMRQTGNVLLVAPTEEIAAREKIELESQKQIEELAPLRSEFIQINYAKAADLASLLKSQDNRLLSERGNVTIDDRTNTLLVQDTAAKLEDIRKLIAKLDVPVRQVLIESRVVIANNDFARDLGVRFGYSGFGERSDIGYSVGGGLPAPTNTIIDGPTGLGDQPLLVDLPVVAPSGAVNFLIGKIGEHLLRLELSAMQTEGRGEVISSPRVITSDKSEAVIQQGVEIPYQEASSSGATSVAFKEAVLELKVTPQITPDDRIIMELAVKKDEADFSRSVLGVPPLNTREINTNVLVEDGETIVLGGVYEQTKSTNTERIPFFGDLPYLGYLFRQESKQNQKQELLIFVTPRILKETLTLK